MRLPASSSLLIFTKKRDTDIEIGVLTRHKTLYTGFDSLISGDLFIDDGSPYCFSTCYRVPLFI